jgi:hypothetical protein
MQSSDVLFSESALTNKAEPRRTTASRTQLLAYAIGDDQMLLRSFIQHSPLSLRLRSDITCAGSNSYRAGGSGLMVV